MAFEDMELSLDDAQPVELFEVSYGVNHWYYTSADRDITWNSHVFKAVPCQSGNAEQTIDNSKTALNLSFNYDVEFAELFRIQPPSEVVSLTRWVQNFLVPDDYIVAWKGRILNCEWALPWVKLITENITSSMKRPGLRRRMSPLCEYSLYGHQCGVNAAAFREDSSVLSLSGWDVVVQDAIGKPDAWYAGGKITWLNPIGLNTESRMILSSVGATGKLTVVGTPIGLTGSQDVSIYPGCDHACSTCDTKFNNKDNCGAIAYSPKRNVFAGSKEF